MRGIGHGPGCIIRTIEALACKVDPSLRVIVEGIESTDWASVTFEGQRHLLMLRLEGEHEQVTVATARIASELGETEIAMSGQFVADIAVDVLDDVAGAGTLAQSLLITALTLND